MRCPKDTVWDELRGFCSRCQPGYVWNAQWSECQKMDPTVLTPPGMDTAAASLFMGAESSGRLGLLILAAAGLWWLNQY